MAMEDHRGKARIQVSISRQLLEMLDNYCNAIGVSRSAFIQTTLGQTLYNINQVQGGLKNLGPALVQAMDKSESADKTKDESGEMWGEDFGKRPAGL
jgi:metal-responsive CopG/Arc/MetJ family transcriptional regulator